MIISVEGNIGSGKSTILEILKKKYVNNKKVVFVDEPVSEWNEIRDGDKSILELFYGNKEKYSFSFQILAYITRLRKLLAVLEESDDKIIICERSIYTDKYVFAKMLYQQKFINDIEWQTYNYWFDTFKDKTKLTTIVYVNTNPEICFERIKKRNRTGESDIPLDYLNHCHLLHTEWLVSSKDGDENIIVFDGNKNLDELDEENYIKSLSLDI
jgi:deoxyadenosine/deoxycytidine kinase